ncbi:FliM/FliN family flagellar motor switch protein [Massilia sp. BJB1822]|uniref:FliM/FliN family flagellar motor switch protein n=1 Tax=Massilia sp. BJB1822 TaxID=2744470 RepID=UPI0015930E25|nr:FliM/FliN family flagellar motor switch protein [Massilia sp. BJB1822]NVE01853.1 FliM/FliN family flagellar motor switch protein [Massilia sp. BJB1822]
MTSTSKAAGHTQIVELAEFQAQQPGGPAILGDNLRLLDSVPVKLAVMVGEIQTTVGELMALQQQAVLKIDRAADVPLDVVVNGTVVARGQLVVVDDNFGVRITEIAAAA